MAIDIPFEDDRGNEYDSTYWVPVQVNLGIADGSGVVTFYGYKDEAAKDAKKTPVGSKQYILTKEQVDALYQVIGKDVYALATDTKDAGEVGVLSVAVDAQAEKVSFFEGAKEI